MKTMASEHLFKMPIIGALCKGCGHLPVAFTSQKDNDFSVDKEKSADVQLNLEQHVQAGGIGAWYPEGTINAGDPTKLQTFRAGGFTLATRVDCEIWCLATVGNAVCWPKRAAMGGRNCNIGARFFRLCESSFSATQQAVVPHGTSPERAHALHLAKFAQDRMQTEIDSLVDAGWASVTPTLLTKSDSTAKK